MFEIINDLNQALDIGRGADVMDKILTQLVEYANMHFAAEEALMEKYAFPSLPTHKVEYQAFARNVAKYLDDFKSGKVGAPSALLLFLQSWLKEHILKSDKAYSGYLTQRGVK